VHEKQNKISRKEFSFGQITFNNSLHLLRKN
jgi:hypothetical protein